MCTDFSNMPKDWAVCFMHDCILKEQCLRYYAAKKRVSPKTQLQAYTLKHIIS